MTVLETLRLKEWMAKRCQRQRRRNSNEVVWNWELGMMGGALLTGRKVNSSEPVSAGRSSQSGPSLSGLIVRGSELPQFGAVRSLQWAEAARAQGKLHRSNERPQRLGLAALLELVQI